MRMTVAAILGLALLASCAEAQQLPDPVLTPGAVASTDQAEVCSPGYSRAHRFWRDKAGTLAKYGLPLSAARDVEDDDLIPVSLGGDNANPLNHWAEPWPQAREKDRLEWVMAREVCGGRVTLQWAQHYFQSNQWVNDLPGTE